jgi:hypothetical protein
MTETDLSLCGICGQPAQFTDAAPGATPVSYCTSDLPAHFKTAAAAGQMPLHADAVTKAELQEEARELEIEGRSKMDKEHLASAVALAHASELPAAVEEPTSMTDAPTSDEVLPTAKKATKAARKR